jgi:quinone-modifying oxidoreductase, subunit QmoB
VEKKLAIYICEGCRIGKAIDTEALCGKMQDELKPAICRSHAALCSPAGVQMIAEDAGSAMLNGCLIAACGEGTKDEVFRPEEGMHVERMNIRELVAWAMEPNEEDTVMAAEDYIRMGYAGLKQMPVIRPFILDGISDDILVVGGGVAGLKAAIDGAEAGYTVHLVERTGVLGGRALQWTQQIPFDRPFGELRDPAVKELVKQVEGLENIHVHLNSTIERIDGQPGAFEVKLTGTSGLKVTGDLNKLLRVGSIVSAMGWKPYKPESGSFYGLGEVPGVMTSVELEAAVMEGSLARLESVLFVQCAGSRDEKHLPYCSSVCCAVSLKQAKYIRDRFPEAVVYIVYKDIRTTGFLEDFYKEMQSDPHIVLIKGEVSDVLAEDGRVGVRISDRLLGEELMVSVDRVVLATGMVPNESTDLKLGYRLGEGLPELRYAFPDSHFICFPYETRRTGIYMAGGIRAPMDIPSAMEDGSGAMMKAIQMIESAKRGEAVHPRAGDRSFPELYMERCTDCKRCTEECPFGTYDETASGTPVVHPNRCRRCGICVGSCPERVIGFAGFSINLLSEKIKAVEVPDEFEEKPRVLLFVCENDALPALHMAARNGLKINPCVRIIPVRCLGSINRVWVSDALSKGYDGILQIGCKPGDDYQCHFIHGSELTGQRSEIYEETLTSMMLEPERIRTEYVEITDYQGIIKHIDDYMEEIELIGPNPFKDM